jgi:hypothetical protein
MMAGMNALSASDSSPTEVVTPVSPPPTGQPSGYSEATVGWLFEAIRWRGMWDTGAAVSLGIARSTLSGWKKEHPELEERLAMAREQFREAKLAIVDEATTRDGRPDWRAAAWALEKAFPEDYGKSARPRRGGEAGRRGWKASTAVLEKAFPEDYGEPAIMGRRRTAPMPEPEGPPETWQPDREWIGALIEENEAVRAQLRELIPES